MTLDALRSFKLPSDDYGPVRVAPVHVVGETWGALEPLRGTEWGRLIPIVPGEVMAEARHGRVRPLMQIIGRPPEALLRLVPKDHRLCAQQTQCGSYRPKDCHPCPTMPDCYDPPELDPEAARMARLVALAWRGGTYVIVVDGPEFSL